MTHRQTTELNHLDQLWLTTGLDAQQHARRNFLQARQTEEVEALANKLNRWADRKATRFTTTKGSTQCA